MKTVRLIAVFGTGLLTAAAVLLACGDDDAVLLAVDDSGVDGQKPDVNRPAIDSGEVLDVNVPDTDVADAGQDADLDAADVDADAAVTFFDAATYDAGQDAGFVPDSGTAAVQLADVFCNTVARCCFGDDTLQQGSGVDGGTYNRTQCLADYSANGFEQASIGATVNPNHIIVDQTGSSACAAKLQALSCNLGFAEFQQIRAACYGALLGTQGPGQSCTASAECQKGLFCLNPEAGAEKGVCTLVRGTGASCGDVTSSATNAQHVCSYRFSGDPARHCDFVAYDGGTAVVRPRDTWTCQDNVSPGSKCPNSAWCSNGLCDFETKACAATVQYFPPSACARYISP